MLEVRVYSNSRKATMLDRAGMLIMAVASAMMLLLPIAHGLTLVSADVAGESVFIGFCVALIGHKLTEQAEHIGEATQSIVELYSLGGKPVNPYRH